MPSTDHLVSIRSIFEGKMQLSLWGQTHTKDDTKEWEKSIRVTKTTQIDTTE